jgi:hypothetical protein
MSEENSNAQVQPPVPPAATGHNVDELQARIAELERQSEGRLREIQNERAKRQELEQRYVVAESSTAQQADANNDELAKVLSPYIAPIKKEAEVLKSKLMQYERDKALAFLSEKLGKSKNDIENVTKLQERLSGIAQKWQVQGDLVQATQRAYELMELEDLRAKQIDASRQQQVASVASMPAMTAPASPAAAREYSVEDFNRMSSSEFDAMTQKGSFRKVDNKIVFTPQ